jgi:hypothetical protein
MDDVARLPARERADLFNEAGARRGLATAIIEKDFWVCWILKRLFALPGDSPALIFKGGTSLSKAFGVIRRFSEDIDLSFDRHDLGYSGEHDPEIAASRKQAARLVDDLVADVQRHIGASLLPTLRDAIGAELESIDTAWNLVIDRDDPQTVNFQYPVSLHGSDYARFAYVLPAVRLELGARGDPWPAERRDIIAFAAEEFPALFKAPICTVMVLTAERTFWEKATILHAEFHRPTDKPFGAKLSRHYYDLAQLAQSDHGERALAQLELLDSVARHKAIFFPSAWGHYGSAKPGTLRLVPPAGRRAALAADYAAMRPMMFDETPPRFTEIIDVIAELERRINGQPGS